MRVIMVNVCVLLMAITVSQATGIPEGIPKVYAKFGSSLEKNGPDLLVLMKTHFDLSMKYLLTSKQYGSEFVQRPGMAKYLDEASSRQWEEGMSILKKFMERGGSVSNTEFKDSFKIEGKPELTYSGNDVSFEYVKCLTKMQLESLDLMKKMNHLHHTLSRTHHSQGGDAEMAHFFDSKLTKEAGITRELTGQVNTLRKMKDLGIALDMFDSNL